MLSVNRMLKNLCVVGDQVKWSSLLMVSHNDVKLMKAGGSQSTVGSVGVGEPVSRVLCWHSSI